MKKGDLLLWLWRIPLDFLGVILGWLFSYQLRPLTDLLPGVEHFFPKENLPTFDFFLPFIAVSAFLFVLLFAFLGNYRFITRFEPIREFLRITGAVFLWGMLLISWYALWRHELIFSRIMLFQVMVFATCFSFAIRFFLRLLQMGLWKMGKNQKRILLVGTNEAKNEIAEILKNDLQFVLMQSFSFSDISSIAKSSLRADELWCCSPVPAETIEQKLHEICFEKHLLYRFIPPLYSPSFAKLELSLIGEKPFVLLLPGNVTAWQRIFKRVVDTCLSFCILFLLSPLVLIIAIAIKCDSAGPVFYKSTRLGREGKKFLLWKFRSMKTDAERQKKILIEKSHRDGPFFKVKKDPRITTVGKILRRFSLDELPNMINVLKGDMSLIGPRPHLPEEVAEYPAPYKRVLMMKPGVTGLAQISGRSDLSFDDEMRLDIFYMENWSFWLDIKILLKTIRVVFSAQGAD